MKNPLPVAIIALFLISIITGCPPKNISLEAVGEVFSDNAAYNTAGAAISETSSGKTNDGIRFSTAGGLYKEAFDLILSTAVKDGIIRYTLDGSDPTGKSAEFAVKIRIADMTNEANRLSALNSGGGFGGGGFGGGRMQRPGGFNYSSAPAKNVFKGSVVKAAVFSQNGDLLSDIFVQSYFVSEDIFTRYVSLPIVSIVTDANNLFSNQTGIYINYNWTGKDWERPVHFEMFEADGKTAVSLNMGVRINGGSTRSLAQKALRFYARTDYDTDNNSIEYEIFNGLTASYGGNRLTSFKRIILRSSGNDNNGSLFRDALMHALVSGLNVNTQASRPCIAFINGEFWGIYNIRERYDDRYFAGHYNIDNDKVTILELSMRSRTVEIKNGDRSDLDLYNQMINFFNNNSLSDAVNYKKAQEYFDVDNFIDYYIANIYSGNEDWPGNNNQFWRYKTDNGGYDAKAVWYMDGRFRWMMKDMDWGFGYFVQYNSNTLSHALNESSGGGMNRGMGGGMRGFTSPESTLMFRKLVENTEFLTKFINRFCDVMNTNYEINTVIAKINEMKSAIEPAIPEQSNRYPLSVSSVGSWENNVKTMIEFAKRRTGYIQSYLANRFSLSEIVSVTLNTDSVKGYIRVNSTDITTGARGVADASSWSGGYFSGTTQTFTAVPLDGRQFEKFLVTDTASGASKEYLTDTINVTLGDGGITVWAVFQ